MRLIWTSIFGLILIAGAIGGWWIYADSQKLKVLRVAAGERGGDSFTLMTEVSEVLDRYSETLRLEVLESRNSSDGISKIENKQVDLATIESNTPAYTNVKLVAELFSDYFLLIARNEPFGSIEAGTTTKSRFPLEKVTQLPGYRVGIPEAGSTGNLSFWSVVDHYKVPPESIRHICITTGKGG